MLDRVLSSTNPDPTAIIQVLRHIVQEVGREIESLELDKDGICMKAAMHTGTVSTFLTDEEEDETRFSFEGLLDHAAVLVSLAQGL